MPKSIRLALFTTVLAVSSVFCHPTIAAKTAAGIVKGKVLDAASRSPLPFVSLLIKGTNTGATTDLNGEFEILNVQPGFVQVQAYLVGYKPKLTEEFYVTNEKTPYITIELEPAPSELTEVEITTPVFNKKDESPLSMQTLGIREIEKNPGGNRDISKVIQSLPGVASTPSFRNDIIIRGGSPSENKFYLDGIEIPVINHFQTQGSTGGPVGIINPDFIREVDFYSGSFPANRGNALSSILDFRQIDGNTEKTRYRGTIGSSDIGFTVDGPAGKNTTYIASLRRSYLQFLFSALKLPFLPTFTDMQFKVRHKFDNKHEIVLLGLGAYDEVNLNLDVNDGITDPDILERNEYILGNLPEYGQWNYTIGTQYRHYGKSSLTTLTLSRNSYNNTSEKYRNNDDSAPQNLITSYESSETENKLRAEHSATRGKLRFFFGGGLETAEFTIENLSYITTSSGPIQRNYSSDIDFIKYSVFGSVSYPFFKNRLTVSAGFRADGNSYSDEMNNPLTQFSPRTGISYSLTEKWFLNAGAGVYYQLPAYTMMGYRDQNGELINRELGLDYITNTQLNGGVEFRPDDKTKITFEAFDKQYSDYPFSLTDSISLANLGSDFGAIGNDVITSSSVGRAYGLEFMTQRRTSEGLYGILAYTLVRSEFKEKNGEYAPSSWDSKHLITLTAGKQLKKNWDLGIKWRFVDGRPYTPYDTAASALKSNWDVRKSGIPDYDYLNDYRLPAFHQLDVRVDKTWFFTHWSLNLYLDIQNIYNFKAQNQDILNVRTDANGQPITSQTDPDRYEIYFIKDDSGTVLPSIGVIVDF